MKLWPVIAVLFLASALGATPAVAGDALTYDHLVAKAQSDGVGVDYTALRFDYAASDQNDPTGLALEEAVIPMLEAVNDGDCVKALDDSEKVLKISFISILPHLVRSACFDKQGELGRAAREDTIVHGLRDSIFESGDGISQKTALVVVTLDEERYVLSAHGQREASQALVEADSHSYDVIKAVAKDGSESTVFFQIDAIRATEARAFAPKH